MSFDRAAWPFVAAALVPAVVLALLGYRVWSLPFLALAGFLLYFFRDPERRTEAAGGEVVAPADGRVVVAGDVEAGAAPPGDWRQISIFLSPMDVHINRAPIAGKVQRIEYRPGRFLPAYKREAARENERNEIWIDHDGQTVVCRQVVGVLARRLVCRVGEGATLAAGERFGLMKFGSRIDLFLPPSATVTVRVGDRVEAGVTVVARLSRAGR
jgi:phosphatidylserine decarboxylase